jgi:hypothetical protein
MMTPVVYLGFAGLGIGLVLFGLALGALGGGHDHDGLDGAIDLDGDGIPDGVDLDGDGIPDGAQADGAAGGLGAGLSLLSMTGLGSLLVGFGALGYLGASFGLGSLLAVPLGLVGSAGTFALTGRIRLWLLRSLTTGRSTGTLDLAGHAAQVTIPVPPAGRGSGQAVVRVGGRPFYVRVMNQTAAELPVGAHVVLFEPVDGVFPVAPLEIEQGKG